MHTSQHYREVKFERSTSVASKKWLSQAICALQKPCFLSSLSPQLGWKSGWLWWAPASISPGCRQQPQLPALSHTRKFFRINFASFCVIWKQECLWLCRVKTSAGGIVRSRQSVFVADKHEELYWLTNVYPCYSNFYSERNEAANLSSPQLPPEVYDWSANAARGTQSGLKPKICVKYS